MFGRVRARPILIGMAAIAELGRDREGASEEAQGGLRLELAGVEASRPAQMQRALGEKLVAEMRPTVEPKLKALEQTVAGRLGVSAPASGAAPAKK